VREAFGAAARCVLVSAELLNVFPERGSNGGSAKDGRNYGGCKGAEARRLITRQC